MISQLKTNGISAVSIFFLLLFASCVTTSIPVPEKEPGESPSVSRESAGPAVTEESNGQADLLSETGIIYSALDRGVGPLLLGSTDYMNGPVVEFSILFSIYFPLSGIEPPFSGYSPGEGTRWQVDCDRLEESVYFERALLSRDDEDKSWWFFKIEGSGFERSYEFLVDKDWRLLEMRYLSGNAVESYRPSVDENNNLAMTLTDGEISGPEKMKLQVPLGDFQADFYSGAGGEFWKSRRVTGSYLKFHRENEELSLTASLIEEKKGYKTTLFSY
ncbi:MAG: hypothetical protein JXR86_21145 [Spirochaetales bacterium]|nr:hypothetical protein [Spirochaetales bacterium]